MKKPTLKDRRRSISFARGIAAAEFGQRYYSWREWDGFVDLTPDETRHRRAKMVES